MDKAYQAYLSKLSRYPKFKSADKYNSFTFPQYGGFQLRDGKLRLSFIGLIRMKMHRIPVGVLKQCTVVRDIDQWYCCVTCELDSEPPATNSLRKAVGVDVGLLNRITLSNGDKMYGITYPDQITRIKALQKRLTRKKPGSANREKARVLLTKEWRKLRRRRDDYAHKASKNLADNYDIIFVEKLNILGMVKNHNLAQAITDATWAKLRTYLAYKARSHGGRLTAVSPYGTSQKCSQCGMVAEPKLGLSSRRFVCRGCGLDLDRDHNAALNILKSGLEQTRAETEPLLVKRISKFQSKKQEVLELGSGTVHVVGPNLI